MKKINITVLVLALVSTAIFVFASCIKDNANEVCNLKHLIVDDNAPVSQIKLDHDNISETYTPIDFSANLWRWQVAKGDIYIFDIDVELPEGNPADSILFNSLSSYNLYSSNSSGWNYAELRHFDFHSDTLSMDVWANNNKFSYCAVFNDHGLQIEYDSIVGLLVDAKSASFPWPLVGRLIKAVEKILGLGGLYHFIDDMSDKDCDRIHRENAQKCSSHKCSYKIDSYELCKGHCVKNENTPSGVDCPSVQL